MIRNSILAPLFGLAGLVIACGGANGGDGVGGAGARPDAGDVPDGVGGGGTSSDAGDVPDGVGGGGTSSDAGDVPDGGTSPGGGTSADGGSSSGGTDGGGGASTGGQGTGEAPVGGPFPPELVWTNETRGTTNQIWGSGPNDIYAAGQSGLLMHSTGDGTWTHLDPGTGANLTGIWGSGPDDVYVAVDSNVILHWTGADWERELFDPGITFQGVWGLDEDHVYAVGGGVRRRLSSGAWELQPVSASAPTTALWASSAANLYVTAGGAALSIVYHSTGDGTWSAQNAPESAGAHDIWGTGPNHIYAASSDAILFSTGDGNWTAQLPVVAGRAVWGANTDAVYACTGGDGLFYRSNGQGDWSEAQEIDTSAVSISCFSIWGTGIDNIYLGTNRGIYRGTLAE